MIFSGIYFSMKGLLSFQANLILDTISKEESLNANFSTALVRYFFIKVSISGDIIGQSTDMNISNEDICLLQGCFMQERRGWAIKHVTRGPYPEGFSKEDWISAKPGGIIPIDDDQVFELGNKTIEVISIPGHSPGCIALLDITDRMLFTGDSIIEGDIWMYLEESKPLEVYLSSLKKLDAVSDRFDMLLPAHCRAPISKTVIPELIKGVERLLDGTLKGRFHRTFAGEGLLQRFETCGVIYNESKMLLK
jgi:hypothetical protein